MSKDTERKLKEIEFLCEISIGLNIVLLLLILLN